MYTIFNSYFIYFLGIKILCNAITQAFNQVLTIQEIRLLLFFLLKLEKRDNFYK